MAGIASENQLAVSHLKPKSLVWPIQPKTRPTDFVRRGLMVIVALGLIVRMRHFIARPSFWYDEAFLLLNIYQKSFHDLAGALNYDQAAPPGFLWLTKLFFVLFGSGEWAMRFPAFAASVTALGVSLFVARRLVGRRFAWLVAAFVAVSQPAIFHAVCVKPYSGDLLAAMLALGVGALSFRQEQLGRGKLIGVLLTAALLPWFSYPVIFVLGAASLAWAVDAIQRRNVHRGIRAAVLAGVSAGSFATMWLLISRYQRSSELLNYWHQMFLDRSSVWAAAKWSLVLIVRIGSYGTTGMGWPLIGFALIGLIHLIRTRPAASTLLIGPIVFAWIANAARMYPLDDRLLFFLCPSLWLLATAGIRIGYRRLQERGRLALMLVVAICLAPGVVRYGYWTAVVPSKVEYRQAFEEVSSRETSGDAWWVSQPLMLPIYQVERPLIQTGMSNAEIVRIVENSHRVWLITTPTPADLQAAPTAALAQLGFRETDRRIMSTLVIVCLEKQKSQ